MAVTRTVGGVTWGYWATGSRLAARPPSRTMTMEMTHARTGRSMKKRATTAGLLSRLRGAHRRGEDGHVHELRLDGGAGPHLLEAADDHPLARPQAVGDLPQAVVQGAHPDRADGHLVGVVDDVQ